MYFVTVQKNKVDELTRNISSIYLSPNLQKIISITFIIAVTLSIISCQDAGKKDNVNVGLTSSWYKQANVDLGFRIKMINADSGFAVTCGRGSINGALYEFSQGKWKKIHEYPYSDFPQFEHYNPATVWLINHLVHNGSYQPVLTSITNNTKTNLPLPAVMWDATDYVMWKSIQVLNDGTAWLAGQQGNIIFYDRKNWSQIKSPVIKDSLKSFLSGDINDLQMLSTEAGWGVGKDGLIIKYENGEWKKYSSPTNNHLNKIYMNDINFGWIVGQKGTILFYDGTKWIEQNSNTPENLNSIKAVNSGKIFISGDNSTLLFSEGNIWKQDEGVKYLEDSFSDLEVIDDSASGHLIWLIGGNGIYTNSKSIGFSFTDFTSQASLRRQGKGGIFFNQSGENEPAFFVINEGGPSLLFENNGTGGFSEKKLTDKTGELLNDNSSTAIADINNDGYNDIFQIHYQNFFRLYLGGGSAFTDFTKQSGLNLSQVEPQSLISSHFWDFNNDGNLDLLISDDENQPIFFTNDGAGQFQNQTISGIDLKEDARIFGATLSDFNNDGLIDIFFPFQTQIENQRFAMYINKGNMNFEEINASTFFTTSSFSSSTTVSISEDFNNDGFMDIFIHNQKSPPVMLLNKGDATFIDASEVCGFNETIFHPEPFNGIINAADLNNDGWTDIFVSSKLYLNSEGCRFKEVSEQTGLNFTGNPVFNDFDNDGDMDLFIGSSAGSLGKGERAILYRNNLNNKNFIKVFLEGDESNRSAFGAMVILTASDSSGNQKYKTQKIFGYGSSPMLQQNISEIHFGIKPDLNYDVSVVFPSGIKKVLNNIQPGEIIRISESDFFSKHYQHLKKSIVRTMLLINYKYEIIKFISVILLFVMMIVLGAKAGAAKFAKSKFFPTLLFLVYLLTIHLSVQLNIASQFIYSLSAIAFAGMAAIFIAREKLKRDKTNLISHYRIKNLLGSGGMGKVYHAVDLNTKKEVALKVINPELLKDPDNKKRFSLEGQLLSSFKHEHIVKVSESGETDNGGFIAMELLEGGTLKNYLKTNYPLSINQIKNIVMQICSGLNEIHSQNIIHRDIKTNNIMFDSSGKIRIMDFGLSKSNIVSAMTTLGSAIGTLGYVAPEQVTNTNVDERTDIFSLGVVMFELATNTLPFNGENEIALIHSIFNSVPAKASSINSQIPSELDNLILKCLYKEASKRYSTIQELLVDLSDI